ncbi:MAG: helix-turn-helix transcriptional regulator [Oscillospiraceae bacterium]|nr:helix-turn-helix transcriptional regulator [Oscillospiraceae bacterium]
MSSKEILKAACKATGTSQNDGAKKIGFTKQQLSSKIVRGTLRADEFLNFLDAVGIDVEFRVRETGKVIKIRVPGMGQRVRCMVDKVIYDTAASDALANNFYADGVNMFTDGKAMELYIDKEGRYFFAEYSDWEGVKDRITPVSAGVAAAFIEKYGHEIQKQPIG